MFAYSQEIMAEEIEMVRRLQAEAREVPQELWADWVNQNKDKVRLSGKDDYVPDQEEWIKRCESFLACMGATPAMPESVTEERQSVSFEETK